MIRAVSAAVLTLCGKTQVQVYLGYTNADSLFLLYADRLDSACRANLTAGGTLRTAVTVLITHYRLHEMLQVRRRTQHTVLAGAHAELAGGAVVIEVLYAAGAKGNQTLRTLWSLLFNDIGKTSVHMVLGMCCCTGSKHSTGYQECASALIDRLIGLGSTSALADRPEPDCALLTGLNAVKAIHATAVIYFMVLGVDASGLALASTLAAVDAFALVNLRTKH